MNDTDIVLSHLKRYPKMTPRDVVKLLYQSEFGCEHMINGADEVLPRLKAEIASVGRRGVPLTERLGGDAVRVNLGALPGGLAPETLAEVFVLSSRMFHGSEASFSERLASARALISSGEANFTEREFDGYLAEYRAAGGGAVHHSESYRDAYRPAYRVIHRIFAPYLPLFARIDGMLAGGARRFAVAVDGRCGAGKSTLASLLSDIYGCGVVHADDFYLPFGQRTGALGGLDAERMRAETDAASDVFTYRAYDPHIDSFTHDVTVPTSPFFVIEGSYSMFAEHGVKYALGVFLTVKSGCQIRRIAARSPERLDDFREKWIPAEEKYFAEKRTAEAADFVIETDAYD